MTAAKEGKVGCRTPAEGRDGVTNIPKWKYDLLSDAILAAVTAAGDEGLRFSDLKDALKERISEEDQARLGSLTWHATTVKLEMEVRGDLQRLNVKGPQRFGVGGAG